MPDNLVDRAPSALCVAICGLVLVALVPARHTAAQSSPSTSVPQYVTGFAGIPWGSREAQVIAKLGKPAHRQHENGGIYLSFQTTLLSYQAITTVLVGDAEGLIKGLYGVSFGPGDGCETVFDELKSAISAKYPSIKSVDSRYNNSSLDFCGGVSIGKAGASSIWIDPSDPDARIAVLLKAGGDDIQVHYEAPGFNPWSERRKKSDDRF
jgi:hypothetical protein